ncbi:endothelin-converting enzyme, metalloprotease family M13 [Thraustotheca clavata]|uniref:Endothelin-converting enzyme, metalloprotease family M13 n=1 Tax=Thraustotheca clavata TaxID=74557 RepID=A0A0A7CM18_9STRA|nr:secreted protein [Thraustotheca clavata]OQS05811.1 endothelin-converting enzyme, metalloprotease family M13 [Thraustotheca clavata]
MVKITVTLGALASAALAGTVSELPKEMTALMDLSADPCNDFYQYACGGWYKQVTIPADRATTDTSFSVLGDKNDAVIRQILTSNYPKVSDYYNSCMDIRTLTSLGTTPIADDLKSIRSSTSVKDLLHVAAQLSKKGVLAFTQPTVYPDAKDATTNALYSAQAPSTLARELYVNPQYWRVVQPAYKQYIVSLMSLAGKSATVGTAAAKTIIDFELQLAGVQLSKLELLEAKTSNYNPMSYCDASVKYPLTVGAQLREYGFSTDGCTNTSGKIILNDLDFFDRVESLVSKQSLDTLKTIFEFKVLHTNAPSLAPTFATANWKLFGKLIQGQSVEPSREKKCTADIQTALGDLVSDYFVKSTFDSTSATRAEEMVLALEASFKQGIENATWLDDETREKALTKLSKFVHLIGAPEKPETYASLSFNNKEYINNRNKINLYDTTANLALVGTKVDRHKWSSPASEVNAYYAPSVNSITFPAGILQAPFFSGKFDPAQNFGGIGMVIGHEITHGFDNSGRNYDGDGNVNDWWSDETSLEFNKKAKCIMDQYGAFQVKSEQTGQSLGNVNGRLTLGETIADNGGLKTAYRAFHEYIKTKPSKFTDETGDKVFFLSFAQNWCSKNTDEYLNLILQDEHPPGKFRIYGAVQNNDAFAKTFKCPANTKMNSSKKCYLWE